MCIEDKMLTNAVGILADTTELQAFCAKRIPTSPDAQAEEVGSDG